MFDGCDSTWEKLKKSSIENLFLNVLYETHQFLRFKREWLSHTLTNCC